MTQRTLLTLMIEAETFSELQKKAIEALSLEGMTSAPLTVAGSRGEATAPLADPPKRGRPPKDEMKGIMEGLKDAQNHANATTQADESPKDSAPATNIEQQSAATTQADESPKTEAGPVDAEAEAGDGALTYETHIKPAVLKVSAHPADKGGGRDGVIKLLEPYGVSNAKDIPQDKWPEVLAAVAELLEAG